MIIDEESQCVIISGESGKFQTFLISKVRERLSLQS